MQYYASLGHNYDEGMLKTDRLNQFNVNIRNNTTSLRINMNIDMTPSAKLVINSNSTYDSYHGPQQDVTAAYGLAFNAIRWITRPCIRQMIRMCSRIFVTGMKQ